MVCCCGHEEYKTLQLRLDLVGNMQKYVYSMYYADLLYVWATASSKMSDMCTENAVIELSPC